MSASFHQDDTASDVLSPTAFSRGSSFAGLRSPRIPPSPRVKPSAPLSASCLSPREHTPTLSDTAAPEQQVIDAGSSPKPPLRRVPSSRPSAPPVPQRQDAGCSAIAITTDAYTGTFLPVTTDAHAQTDDLSDDYVTQIAGIESGEWQSFKESMQQGNPQLGRMAHDAYSTMERVWQTIAGDRSACNAFLLGIKIMSKATASLGTQDAAIQVDNDGRDMGCQSSSPMELVLWRRASSASLPVSPPRNRPRGAATEARRLGALAPTRQVTPPRRLRTVAQNLRSASTTAPLSPSSSEPSMDTASPRNASTTQADRRSTFYFEIRSLSRSMDRRSPHTPPSASSPFEQSSELKNSSPGASALSLTSRKALVAIRNRQGTRQSATPVGRPSPPSRLATSSNVSTNHSRVRRPWTVE